MKLFFDTSALVKFFHQEDGTDSVTKWILSEDNELWILELAKVEFYSSLFRKFRNRELNENSLGIALNGFDSEMSRFKVEPIRNS